jgi:hypothetical protein
MKMILILKIGLAIIVPILVTITQNISLARCVPNFVTITQNDSIAKTVPNLFVITQIKPPKRRTKSVRSKVVRPY